MKKAVEVRGAIYSIAENNGVFELATIPSVWLSMGDTFVALEDMEVSMNGKIFNVKKDDIVFVFRRGDAAEIVTFRNDTIANYINTNIEERNKPDKETDCCCCDKISASA